MPTKIERKREVEIPRNEKLRKATRGGSKIEDRVLKCWRLSKFHKDKNLWFSMCSKHLE